VYNVVIFGYDFTHKKSEDFIHILKKNKVNIVAYIAASSKKLNLPEKKYKKQIPQYVIYNPKELCNLYDIPFYQSEHNSDTTIDIIKKTNSNLGIISGARILKEEIIELCEYGIINFHPGKIPEASGLDGLYWSIYKNIKSVVTTHFIDSNIDAGQIIFSEEVKVDIDDRIEDIKNKIYITECKELEKLSILYLSKKTKIKSNVVGNYITANKPMDVEKQLEVLEKFERWKCENSI